MTKGKNALAIVEDITAEVNELKDETLIQKIKSRPLITPHDVVEFMSDVIDAAKTAGDCSKTQRQAFTIATLCNTALKAMKIEIDASPAGQQRDINKLKVVAALAKGLTANQAKQVLLDKSFQSLDVEVLEEATPAEKLTNDVRDNIGRSDERETAEHRSPQEQYDTQKSETQQRTKAARLERARLLRERQAKADSVGNGSAGVRPQSTLDRFIKSSNALNEPFYDIEGREIGISGATTDSAAKNDSVWTPDLSFLD